MSRIIAVANQKGGVGKTTTTVNLSAALVSMHKRVLLIDLDPQGNASMGCGIDKHDMEKGIFDVLVDGMSVAEARHKSPENGCDVLPANSDLTAAEVELMGLEEREQRLHRALQAVRDDYDFMLIDCPPSLNILTLNAFVAADSVLVPIQCEYYALEGLSALLETIDGVRESVNPDIAIEGLLRTMYDGRNRLGVEVSSQLIEHFGDQVFRTVVPRNVRLAEAPSHGISIMEYDRNSRGALAYLALAGEIVRQQGRAAKSLDAIGAVVAIEPLAAEEQPAVPETETPPPVHEQEEAPLTSDAGPERESGQSEQASEQAAESTEAIGNTDSGQLSSDADQANDANAADITADELHSNATDSSTNEPADPRVSDTEPANGY